MYWEDYAIGDQFNSSGRTVTDADIRLFIGATNATHPAHLDAEYAKKHPFGRITIQGALLVGIVDGFAVVCTGAVQSNVMHYGYDRIRFLKPVFVGDTVRLHGTVAELRERGEGFGLVYFDYQILNQNGELVCVMRDIAMFERKKNEG
jgi:acyl dehydratase